MNGNINQHTDNKMNIDNIPEKIILSADSETGLINDEWVLNDYTDNVKIEYTRTDSIIEKAIRFFEPYITDNSGGYERERIIEDFKKYIQ